MRIGYLVPEFPSQTHAFFWREIQALRNAGAEVLTVSTRETPACACAHAFAEEARRETTYLLRAFRPPQDVLTGLARLTTGIGYLSEWKESSLPARAKGLALLPLACTLRRWVHENQIDHIHCHSCATSAHLVALCERLGGPPYSLTLHGGLGVYGRDHLAKMRGAKFVAMVTQPLQDSVMELTGRTPDQAPIIPMGIIPERYLRPCYRVHAHDPFHLITVGRLNVVKGHRLVLEALAALRKREKAPLRYTIVGAGDEAKNIENFSRRMNLEDTVTFTGSLSEEGVSEALRASHVFVLASFGNGEAAPVAVMEAMATGIPVVSSRIGGVPAMINHEQTGLLYDQKNVVELTALLERLIDSPVEAQELGLAGRRHAEAHFSVDVSARRLLSAISAPSPGGGRSESETVGQQPTPSQLSGASPHPFPAGVRRK